MRTFYLFFLAQVLATFSLSAQVGNALHFDNIDDEVTAYGASNLIANGEITLAFWVNSANTTGSFPDYEGFAGIRNNMDADFYILKLGPSTIEARFRNSNGTNFDITGSYFSPNTWQHYAFTYDGNETKLYYNGALVGTTAASGAITSTAEDFLIGKLNWTGNPFYLDGAIDEIGLWNRAITQDEVTCIYQNNIPNNSEGLQLHYTCDQGVAGGNNSSIDILTDAKGNLDAEMLNFELLSTTSNFVEGNTDAIPTITDYLCPGVPYVVGNTTYTQAGFYYTTTDGACGQNSFLQLFDALDTLVQVNGLTLSSVLPDATYQWKNCDNGQFVAGADGQSFTPSQTGTYQLVITANGCTASSSCYFIALSSNNDLQKLGITAAPVPAETETVLFDAYAQNRSYQLVAADGRILAKGAIESNRQVVSLIDYSVGAYWIQVWDNGTLLGALPVQKR